MLVREADLRRKSVACPEEGGEAISGWTHRWITRGNRLTKYLVFAKGQFLIERSTPGKRRPEA